MELIHSISTLSSYLEHNVRTLLERYPQPTAGDFLSTVGPYELTYLYRDLPGVYLIKYYGDLARTVTNCFLLPALQMRDPHFRDFQFCLELAAEALRSHLYSEVMFTLLKKVAEAEGPLYLDHILHIMNVYLFGDKLLGAQSVPSAVIPNRTGCHLLLEKLKDSDSGKACAELLGRQLVDLSEDLSRLPEAERLILAEDECLIRSAWRIASYCHDIGLILSLTAQIMSEKQPRALGSGTVKFEDSWQALCEAFNKGLEAFKGAVPSQKYVEGVLDELYGKLRKRGCGLGLIDHGQASASLLMNCFANGHSDMKDANKAAFFLAICAIFRHTEITKGITKQDTYEDKPEGIHKSKIWQEDPFAAFLSTVDELQGFVARLGWYVDRPPRVVSDPILIEIPIKGFMPIKGMKLDDDKIEWESVVKESIDGWVPCDVPTECKRRYMAEALKRLGLVSHRFEIPSCTDDDKKE